MSKLGPLIGIPDSFFIFILLTQLYNINKRLPLIQIVQPTKA